MKIWIAVLACGFGAAAILWSLRERPAEPAARVPAARAVKPVVMAPSSRPSPTLEPAHPVAAAPAAAEPAAPKASAEALGPRMEKFATPDEVLAYTRGMSARDREHVDAELMRDAYESGRITEPPAVLEEIARRANETLAHPGRGLSREEAVANARRAAEAARRRRT